MESSAAKTFKWVVRFWLRYRNQYINTVSIESIYNWAIVCGMVFKCMPILGMILILGTIKQISVSS